MGFQSIFGTNRHGGMPFRTIITGYPEAALRRAGLLESNSHEEHSASAARFRGRELARRAGRSAAGRRQPAVHARVLLQGAMGTPAGVPAALPQESLPAAEKEYRERPHAVGEDRDTRQSHDRGIPLGLSPH